MPAPCDPPTVSSGALSWRQLQLGQRDFFQVDPIVQPVPASSDSWSVFLMCLKLGLSTATWAAAKNIVDWWLQGILHWLYYHTVILSNLSNRLYYRIYRLYTGYTIQYLGLSNATSKATGSRILRQGSSNVPEVAATVVTVAEGPKVWGRWRWRWKFPESGKPTGWVMPTNLLQWGYTWPAIEAIVSSIFLSTVCKIENDWLKEKSTGKA